MGSVISRALSYFVAPKLKFYVNNERNKYADLIMYGSAQAAGVDIPMPYKITIMSQKQLTIDTGVHFEIPKGHYGQLNLRSSMAKKGLSAYMGIIDSDYRGSVSVIVQNNTEYHIDLNEGERFAQIIIQECARPRLVQVNNLSSLSATARGTGGFGSTGTHAKK